MALAVTRNLTTTSNGLRWDKSTAAANNPAAEVHFTAFIRVALLRWSCARPFATHACHTTSSSGLAAGGTHAFCNSSDSTKADMPCPHFFSRSPWGLDSTPGHRDILCYLGDLRGR